jgi:acyl-CoA thioesterase FadM
MGLVHTPRVLASIAKGLYRGRQQQAAVGAAGTGFSMNDPHVATGRVGLFDIDYLGHMNNAAYLTAAEYARWEWAAQNGVVRTCYEQNCEFIVASATVRYRREMKPLFRKFAVDTALCGLDDRTFSIYQTFRYPGSGGVNKIRAQVLLSGVIRQGRSLLNPGEFVIKELGVDPAMLDSIEDDQMSMEALFQKNIELQDMLKEAAAADDERVDPTTK